jgi:hypothetical protein
MALRRMKSYTGSSGYVYQYYFVGKRAALPSDPAAPAQEYIFDVSSDPKVVYSVSVLLGEPALTAWQQEHGQTLSDSEQYAAAKMRLFQAFDEVPDLFAEGRRLVVDSSNIVALLSPLDLT